MQKDDVRTLKRKISAILTNIEIYKNDIRKAKKKLKSKGIESMDDIDNEIEKRKSEIKKLDKEKDKLLTRASRLLKGVSDD